MLVDFNVLHTSIWLKWVDFLCFGAVGGRVLKSHNFIRFLFASLSPPHAGGPGSDADADSGARVPAHLLELVLGGALVRSLLVLKVAQPLVVTVQLFPQDGVLLGGPLFVQLETTDAVEPFHVQPAAEPHAHAVHDQVGLDVDLEVEKRKRKS